MGTFREFRRRFRARARERKLERERLHYHARFERGGLSVLDDAALRERLKQRWPALAPRAKGSLRVLSIYHDYNWEGASLAPSLAAFGEVLHIDWRDPQLASGKAPDDSGWHDAMQRGVLERARDWKAQRAFDVVFTYLSGEQATPEFMRALRELDAPMVNLSLNDKEAFVGRVRRGHASGLRDICKYFDLCWTSTEDALEKYIVEGATPLYLPEGANPRVHHPYPEEKVYDVGFVGQCYGNRPDTIARLRAAGIGVETFGPGWPNGPLSTEEMVRTWSRCRINLGFGGVADLKGAFCLKGRDFEVPMSGGLYLTEHHDELLPYYEIGREIVTYSSLDDLVGKIRGLLANPAEAEAIRQAGYARALREHTWEQRIERAFRLLGVLA